MTLEIHTIGEIETPDGETIVGVILTCPVDDIKEVAHLWGQEVIITPVEPEDRT